MADIVWRNDVRRLGDLVPWEHNPKRMDKKAGEGLHISLEKFGYALPMLVSPNNDLYDGHQRLPLRQWHNDGRLPEPGAAVQGLRSIAWVCGRFVGTDGVGVSGDCGRAGGVMAHPSTVWDTLIIVGVNFG